MDERPLPTSITCRADVDALLAAATNYEEKLPRDPLRKALNLDRMRLFLAALGDPQKGPRTVHVAGSKGKGTVSRLVAAGLRRSAAGRGPVGLYTSPHLEDLTERIAIDGQPVSEAALAAAADPLLPHLHTHRTGTDAPTFFEIMTAMAWRAFIDAGCTDVVLETGLGGRFDATTVCEPAVTVVTSIELEHTRQLGNTIAAIAGEKAAILKPGVPAVTTAEGDALRVVRERAEAIGAPLTTVGTDARLSHARSEPGPRLHFTLEDPDGGTHTANLPVAGVHHAANAAAAFLTLRLLGVEAAVAWEGLAQARLPGLMETVAAAPTVLIDGAHTPASAAAARRALEDCWPGRRTVLLTAVLREKNVAAIAAALGRGAVHVVATQVATPRAVPCRELAAAIREVLDVPVEALPEPATALARARSLAGQDGLVFCAGSIYLAGTVRSLARPTPGRPGDSPGS